MKTVFSATILMRTFSYKQKKIVFFNIRICPRIPNCYIVGYVDCYVILNDFVFFTVGGHVMSEDH